MICERAILTTLLISVDFTGLTFSIHFLMSSVIPSRSTVKPGFVSFVSACPDSRWPGRLPRTDWGQPLGPRRMLRVERTGQAKGGKHGEAQPRAALGSSKHGIHREQVSYSALNCHRNCVVCGR